MCTLSKIAFFAARRGQEDLLGTYLLSLVPPSRAEAGNLRYEIFQDASDNGLWIAVEDWRSEADFNIHMATSYVQAFLNQVPGLCDGDPDIRSYYKRSPADHRAHCAETSQADLKRGTRSAPTTKGLPAP